jgi:hypothetical protein
MVSGIFVNDSGRILVSLFVWIGKRVTTLLPIFFYHKLAQSLLTMSLGRVVTPPDLFVLHIRLHLFTSIKYDNSSRGVWAWDIGSTKRVTNNQ